MIAALLTVMAALLDVAFVATCCHISGRESHREETWIEYHYTNKAGHKKK